MSFTRAQPSALPTRCGTPAAQPAPPTIMQVKKMQFLPPCWLCYPTTQKGLSSLLPIWWLGLGWTSHQEILGPPPDPPTPESWPQARSHLVQELSRCWAESVVTLLLTCTVAKSVATGESLQRLIHILAPG